MGDACLLVAACLHAACVNDGCLEWCRWLLRHQLPAPHCWGPGGERAGEGGGKHEWVLLHVVLRLLNYALSWKNASFCTHETCQTSTLVAKWPSGCCSQEPTADRLRLGCYITHVVPTLSCINIKWNASYNLCTPALQKHTCDCSSLFPHA